MAKTALSPLQIERQIATLQARLAQARKGAGKVIAKIKKDVAKYGITAEDIFGAAKATAATQVATFPAPAKAKVPAKYSDGSNTWSGRGAQPRWLRAAIEDGKKIEEFLIGAAKQVSQAAKAKVSPVKKTAPKAAKKAAPTKKAAPVKKAAPTKRAAPVKKAAAAKPAAEKAAAPSDVKNTPAPKKAAARKTISKTAAPKQAAKKAAPKPKKAAPAKAPSAPAAAPTVAPAGDKP